MGTLYIYSLKSLNNAFSVLIALSLQWFLKSFLKHLITLSGIGSKIFKTNVTLYAAECNYLTILAMLSAMERDTFCPLILTMQSSFLRPAR